MKIFYLKDNDESVNEDNIIEASYRGDADLVSRLLNEGVDVNTVDPRDNLTCLHIACLQGDEKLVNVILERERTHGDVDFTIKSAYRPRLAWQFAMNANYVEIAHKVDEIGFLKQQKRQPEPS